MSELLDLNSIVMVSAESAPSVEKLLAASQWGDEPVPATVVLLDSDGEGDLTKAKITGKNLKPSQVASPDERRGNKKLVEEQFVLQVGKLIPEPIRGQKAVTTEDVLPPKFYAAAVIRYVKRWYGSKYAEIAEQLDEAVSKPEFASGGVVAGATEVFNVLVHDHPKAFDKLGVLQEAVALLAERPPEPAAETVELQKRLVNLCHELRRAVSACQQAARRSSGKQSIQRIIDDYFKTHKESSSVFAVQLLLERIQRDTKLPGADGEKLDGSLNRLLSDLSKARAADQQHLRGEQWKRWKGVITAIRKDPLDTTIKITEDGPTCDTGPDETFVADLKHNGSNKDMPAAVATSRVAAKVGQN